MVKLSYEENLVVFVKLLSQILSLIYVTYLFMGFNMCYSLEIGAFEILFILYVKKKKRKKIYMQSMSKQVIVLFQFIANFSFFNFKKLKYHKYKKNTKKYGASVIFEIGTNVIFEKYQLSFMKNKTNCSGVSSISLEHYFCHHIFLIKYTNRP